VNHHNPKNSHQNLLIPTSKFKKSKRNTRKNQRKQRIKGKGGLKKRIPKRKIHAKGKRN
jgi:hypothetical protein